VRRGAKRARTDRAELHAILDEALVCHLGVLVGDSAGPVHPVVLPTAFAHDLGGPDDGGSLYVHGSVASQSLRAAPTQEICVSVTLLDGLVLARSGFHHSMNYRSAIVIGRGRLVEDPAEKTRALDLIVDHVAPGRSTTLRPHTRKELAATSVVALPLAEASVKTRTGDPVDEEVDVAAGAWAGVVPVHSVLGEPVTAADAHGVPVSADVAARVLPGGAVSRS